jgi:dienelactone hydrolase
MRSLRKVRWVGYALALVAAVVTGSSPSRGAIHTEVVTYQQGTAQLQGYLAYDDTLPGPRPGVLIVHPWTGEGPYVEGRARQLAQLGYVAFACDFYGVGVRPSTPPQAAATSAIYKNDRTLTRARVNAALDVLRANKRVDGKRIVAIGYCFGGMCALELARSGADIAGVVVFHGALDTPTPQDAVHIRCPILALQGGDDPNVPQSVVEAFEEEMRAAHVDWQLVQYGNTVHAFTDPSAGNDPSRGAAYNPVSDRRSWRAMLDFFDEIFGRSD